MTARPKRRAAEPAADYGLRLDRGADGLAMKARPRVMVVVEDDTASEDGSRVFTRTEVLRYQDGVLQWFAADGTLWGRRLDAAAELGRLYHEGRNAPVGYRQSGAYGGGEMSDERAEAWRLYCRALDHLPKRCEGACVDVARNLYPTGHNTKANVLEGFGILADYWRLPPDKRA